MRLVHQRSQSRSSGNRGVLDVSGDRECRSSISRSPMPRQTAYFCYVVGGSVPAVFTGSQSRHRRKSATSHGLWLSQYSLRDFSSQVEVFMFPPNFTSKRYSTDMGVITAAELHYRRRLLTRRTMYPVDAASRRRRTESMNMLHGTWSLKEGYVPHVLDAARPLEVACSEVTGTIITR